MTKYGFLFDVDGCITPKNAQELHAPVDRQLLPWFRRIKEEGYPIAYITGRAYPFMKETAPELFQEDYLCFFEYGWCKAQFGKHEVNPTAQQWRNQYIEKMISICS